MSAQEMEEAAWGIQVANYVTCGFSFLVIYRIFLNLDDEVTFCNHVDLLWLTYGGMMETVYGLGHNGTRGDAIFDHIRSERSKKVFTFVVVCFLITQALNIASFIDLMAKVSVFVSFGASICGYEAILLLMVLYRFLRQLRSRRGETMGFNTFLDFLARNHAFYFLMATIAWACQLCSALSDFKADTSDRVTQQYNATELAIGSAVSMYSFCMLGPIMFLSILRYDDYRVQGGTYDGTEVNTMRFAADDSSAADIGLGEHRL
ncbi:hypothetical protein CONPUDRAFT_70747 [Coniophora puteana RWD-64-598 SS2]|uniref:Transmembrane protein n=1 Tax=Coniophora puteana (strain RWD-64-598) TaxID=741705 RepID=A0A5M3MYT2_CONPW|nr:uncharacterized protein CONPUDRAFT_70747 [Coniophora puteana RWD-64-598 SS2]EIW83805.1 hypothetical protein CONPUDRAFT_70747 [Coniophora puteana RWD-64-598 SS2]